MNTPAALMRGAALLLVATGLYVWQPLGIAHSQEVLQPQDVPEPHETPAPAEAVPEQAEALPIPPVPPRIAEGEEYEGCLAMLAGDPMGANAYADAWEATGGGEGAAHCHALAQVALGNVDTGADMLDQLAGQSHAPAVARASVYGQADQAWLMAGQADRAMASATLALSLSGDDAELLIDRSVAAATLERYDDAIDDLNHALELDGRRPDALVLRAAAWRHTGRLDLAQDDIDRAFGLDPENPEAFLERGILRQRRGDRDGARQDWGEAGKLAPDSATRDLAEQNLALLEAGPDQR